jgi:hypothetical protein
MMRAFLLASFVSALTFSTDAQAQSAQIGGKFGYLGEYELSADVVAQESNGSTDFIGSMTVKHVGLCTHSGPDHSDGHIVMQLNNRTSHLSATLLFDDQECSYSGRLSRTDIGQLICSGSAVPFSIWFK